MLLRRSRRNREMSLAGLRYGAKGRWNLSAPAFGPGGNEIGLLYIFATGQVADPYVRRGSEVQETRRGVQGTTR